MNRGKQRAKVNRKKDEEFGTIVKRRGNLIIALD
jgi:hypothetical protein